MPRFIVPTASRFWLYEPTRGPSRGTADCPADSVWMRLVGECDASGRVIDTSLAGGRTPFTPLQVAEMRTVMAEAA